MTRSEYQPSRGGGSSSDFGNGDYFFKVEHVWWEICAGRKKVFVRLACHQAVFQRPPGGPSQRRKRLLADLTPYPPLGVPGWNWVPPGVESGTKKIEIPKKNANHAKKNGFLTPNLPRPANIRPASARFDPFSTHF